MFCLTTLLLICIASSCAEPEVFYDLDNLGSLFDDYIQMYHKDYNGNDEEYMYRFNIFRDNVEQVNELNKLHNGRYKINKFSDLTKEEFAETYLTEMPMKSLRSAPYKIPVPNITTLDSIDWRDHNVIAEVKDQSICRSCYAFSAIGSIESQYAIATGQLITLSEQHGLDCDTRDNACVAGWPHNVMEALIVEGGVMSDQDYPYEAAQGQCRTDISRARVRLTGYTTFDLTDEESLKYVVSTYGPTSIALNTPTSLQQYDGIVVAPEDCYPGVTPNHAVLLVGYSVDQCGTPYWIIKNSWGAGWGADGYLYLKMGGNLCSVLSYAAVPSVECHGDET